MSRGWKCAACGCAVEPGSEGVTYSGRTGYVLCAEDGPEGFGVPLTVDLAAALSGEREWTQADEDHVCGTRYA